MTILEITYHGSLPKGMQKLSQLPERQTGGKRKSLPTYQKCRLSSNFSIFLSTESEKLKF